MKERHSEWLFDPECGDWECLECLSRSIDYLPFCPHCGAVMDDYARMEGEQNE